MSRLAMSGDELDKCSPGLVVISWALGAHDVVQLLVVIVLRRMLQIAGD
jgi:hypothetical protein